jgi:signal peptidase II
MAAPSRNVAFGQPAAIARSAAFVAIAAGAFALDCLSKLWVFSWRGWPDAEQPIYWLIPNYLGVQTSVNHGAVFGLGAGFTWVFASLSFVALGAIGYFALLRRERLEALVFYTLAFVAAGILGNLYDRLGLYHTPATPDLVKYGVRDWILFQCPAIPLPILNPWPNFNFADCFLVVGAGVLAWRSWYDETDPSKTGVATSATPSSTP